MLRGGLSLSFDDIASLLRTTSGRRRFSARPPAKRVSPVEPLADAAAEPAAAAAAADGGGPAGEEEEIAEIVRREDWVKEAAGELMERYQAGDEMDAEEV